MALGIGLYLIPLGMVANPDLIRLFENPAPALLVFFKMGVSLAAVSYGIIAPKAPIVRASLVVAGLIGIFI